MTRGAVVIRVMSRSVTDTWVVELACGDKEGEAQS